MLCQLYSYTLQHKNINSLHNRNYPFLKCGNIWNRGFVDTVLDVGLPTKEKIQEDDIKGARWPGDLSMKANPHPRKMSILMVPNINRPMSRYFVLLKRYGHWSNEVRKLLNNIFLGNGLASWTNLLASALHLYHSLGFFFWVYVKDCVYEAPAPDLATLPRRIFAVIQTVDVAMLWRIWMESEYLLDILRATRGRPYTCGSECKENAERCRTCY